MLSTSTAQEAKNYFYFTTRSRDREKEGGYSNFWINSLPYWNSIKYLYFLYKKCLTTKFSRSTTWWFWCKMTLHDVSRVLMSSHDLMAPYSWLLLSSHECSLLHRTKLMSAHCCSCVLIGNQEHSWLLLAAYECSWVLMSAHDCSWALLSSHEHSWAWRHGAMSPH